MTFDKTQLANSNVVFNEIDHSYSFLGNRLSGVTSLLSRTLFRDKYSGISKEVLAKAAEYGHNIHEQIELVDTLGVQSETPAVLDYLKMKADLGVDSIANEYLVSDESHVASSIDVIFSDLSLADIKTTSKLDMSYLSWQLSFYAYLFERQNPGLKASRLLAIWLPKPRYGKSMIVEVPRKSADAIELLIEWDKSLTQQNS